MIRLKALKNEIPLPIRLFLGKALLFFVLWKVIYGVFLYDLKIPDHPLTIHIGEASAQLLNNISSMSGFASIRESKTSFYHGKQMVEEASKIYHNGKEIIYVIDRCNGLELIVLYIGFIVCMPSKFWRKLLFIIAGAILLDITNILRCSVLIYLQEYHRAYFEIAHYYLFKASMYTITFLMWIIFARKIKLNDEAI